MVGKIGKKASLPEHGESVGGSKGVGSLFDRSVMGLFFCSLGASFAFVVLVASAVDSLYRIQGTLGRWTSGKT